MEQNPDPDLDPDLDLDMDPQDSGTHPQIRTKMLRIQHTALGLLIQIQ